MTALACTPSDLDLAARTLYGECRGEPVLGQQGVAWVLRNRVEWPGAPHWWGSTVGGVCIKAAQFSCWLKTDPNYPALTGPSSALPGYDALMAIVEDVMAGNVPDPTGHASHYERIGTKAAWSKGQTFSAVIGHHSFYSLGPGA